MTVQIDFNDTHYMDRFVRWFREEGFDKFTHSEHNDEGDINNPITCLASDEELEEGHWFTLD